MYTRPIIKVSGIINTVLPPIDGSLTLIFLTIFISDFFNSHITNTVVSIFFINFVQKSKVYVSNPFVHIRMYSSFGNRSVSSNQNQRMEARPNYGFCSLHSHFYNPDHFRAILNR